MHQIRCVPSNRYLFTSNKQSLAINELNRRFSDENLAIFRGVGASMPGRHVSSLQCIVLASLAQQYI